MINTHVHTHYSLLDGVGTAKENAAAAAALGQPALGISDHGTLSGVMHHIEACKGKDKKGNKLHEPIFPLVGMEAYFKPDRGDESINHPYHLCLYAKNLKGWHSLLRIATDAHVSGYYGKYSSVDYELLERHREGLIVTSACLKGYLAKLVLEEDEAAVDEYMSWVTDIFRDDFFVEIQPHDIPEQYQLNIKLINVANKWGVPIHVSTDAHYPVKEHFQAYQVSAFMAIKQSYKSVEKKKEQGKRVLDFDLPTLYLMSEDEIQSAFRDNQPDIPESIISESIQNTHEIVARCTPFTTDRSLKFPNVKSKFPDPEKQIREWAKEGFERVGRQGDQEYIDRFEREMAVLKSKSVLDYFVLVGEAVRWAKKEKIRVGLGRGSAAGCLVSYLIGITAIDPIAYKLLFERFLNPARKGMPDIDIDFSSEGREAVKKHLRDMWGDDKVSDIIAHSTQQPKQVLKGVCRVFDIPYQEVQDIVSTINIKPDDEENTLELIRPINPILDDFANKYPDIWKIANILEGKNRNSSKHAAGVIIADKPIKEYMSLERGNKGDLVTAWNDSIEFPVITEMGFLKVDFLGIDGLSIQDQTLKFIKERKGVDIDLNDLPIMRDPTAVDPKVMDNFAKGLNVGVWQFSGGGISDLLKQMKPDSITDLIAANALYRPGPMEMAFEYGKRKKLPMDDAWFIHPKAREYLEETYGIIAFQEQLMQIVQAVGEFTPAQADDMRKAMGKLYRLPGKQAQEFMAGYYDQWMSGCKNNGVDKDNAENMWRMFLDYGNYSFNKSHSASYSIQAYQDGYLKNYDPISFYASFMSGEEDKKKKPLAIRESRMFDVKILPPDVTTSGFGFTIDGESLRYGLKSINTVGDVVAQDIIDRRPYKDMEEFEAKLCTKGDIRVKSNVKKALINCGALDCFGQRDGWSDKDKTAHEKELLGVGITISDAVVKYKDLIEKYVTTKEGFDQTPSKHDLPKDSKFESLVVIGGEIVEFKEVAIKNGPNKGKPMAHFKVAYGVDEYKCVLFPQQYLRYQELLSSEVVLVNGFKDAKIGSPSVIVEHMTDIEQLAKQQES